VAVKGLTIEPSRQGGAYVALCYLDESYVPLSDDELKQLRDAGDAPADRFYDVLLRVVGTSTYLREKVAELWARGDATEQARQLQAAVKQIPAA
jgi:hypothetical protein